MHRITTLYEKSIAVITHSEAEKPASSLFIERKALIDKIINILGQKQDSSLASIEEMKELDGLQKRLLIESFKPLADKSSAELVSMEKIKGREAEIRRINEQFSAAVEQIQDAIDRDEQLHTSVSRNGVEIASEDILADFVNNHS